MNRTGAVQCRTKFAYDKTCAGKRPHSNKQTDNYEIVLIEMSFKEGVGKYPPPLFLL